MLTKTVKIAQKIMGTNICCCFSGPKIVNNVK